MFKELVPVLRDRAVLLTVTLVDADQIRVNIVPKKLKEGDNDALTTPLSVTGTAEDLDAELSSTIVGFVSSHLQMKNTLEKAKAEMDAASKVAQAEAHAKSKTTAKQLPPKAETTVT
ncbi:MAG: PRTRC system protein E, partial [Terracidiphilus sp.]